MLCKTGDLPFDDKEWAFEIKWDGYRAIADLRDHEKIRLYSRNGIDFSEKFKTIIKSLNNQTHNFILDGEIVAYDHLGKPNFQLLQNNKDTSELVLIYQIFDLIWLNGYSTENLTYLQRKELLKDALIENENIKYHDYILEKGKSFYKAANDLDLEGIVAKKTDSLYRQNLRSSEWLKIKANKTDEAIICGYTAPKKGRSQFGSLILGQYKEEELIFVGHAGTGFNENDLSEIYKKMQGLKTSKIPFRISPKTNGTPTWVKPEIIVEIKYTEITRNHLFRHPVFLRIRKDKNVNQITSDIMKIPKKTSKPTDQIKKIGGKELKLTNQNKIYFPEDDISKGDIIEFYQNISQIILPHLKNRPQSMHRFPNGIKGMSFYQKDAAEETPDWISIEKVYSDSSEKNIHYILCNDKATLAYLNNLGCIELNIWSSKINKPENPDFLVLDLDPSDRNTFEDVIETAQSVKEILDLAEIEGFPKTSGSTGMHIYIPLNAKYNYDQVKNFGNLLMQYVQQLLPDLTTLERNLQKREKNKIYLDYLQNRRSQTLASVYSIRPKKGAPVSMPLEWKEVTSGIKPTDYNIFNAQERIKEKGDLFKPVLGKGIDMLKAIQKLETTHKTR